MTREEPLAAASPLWAMPNVLITPHTAGETQRYEDAVIDILLENLDRLWRRDRAEKPDRLTARHEVAPHRSRSAGRRHTRRVYLGRLDRLLADNRIRFGAVSGSSAGAMNAVALAAGLNGGGRSGARETLRRF